MRHSSSLRKSPISAMVHGGTIVPQQPKKETKIKALYVPLNDINYYSMNFVRPVWIKQKTRECLFSGLRDLVGVFVIKDMSTNQLITISHSSNLGLHISRYVKVYLKQKKDVGVSWVLVKSSEFKQVRKRILETYIEKPLDLFFQSIRKYLRRNTPVPLNLLHFRDPFIVNSQNKTERPLFREYNGRSGIYIIKENDMIVYVGKSVYWLPVRMYAHLHKVPVDPFGRRRVGYNDKLSGNCIKVAFIEVPHTLSIKGKTQKLSKEEIDHYCTILEDKLIRDLQPPDNKKGKYTDEEKAEMDAIISQIEKDNTEFFATMSQGKGDDLPF